MLPDRCKFCISHPDVKRRLSMLYSRRERLVDNRNRINDQIKLVDHEIDGLRP